MATKCESVYDKYAEYIGQVTKVEGGWFAQVVKQPETQREAEREEGGQELIGLRLFRKKSCAIRAIETYYA